MEIKPKKVNITVTSILLQENNLPEVVPTLISTSFHDEEIEEIVNSNLPIQINPLERMSVRLENCPLIPNLDVLKDKLDRLGIRFDTDPKVYQKADYWLLICILYRALTHLYDIDVRALIISEWLNPHSDNYIPSEKLVADTIQELDGKISLETVNRIQAVADEAAIRLLKDQLLLQLVNNEITRVSELISQETYNRQSEISRVEGLISAEESARQLADLNLQNTKQDNLTAGNNISINGTTISAVDTTYTASDFDIKDLSDSTNLRQAWSGKQDELTAGENIQINGTTISATDTIYDDTEVRGLIDAVDLKVDNLDEFTCDTIVPTTTNFVEGTDYTVHEALQRTANLFEGYLGYIDDINELIPNQATSSNQLADKEFVNSTVATNAANFRGNWSNYTAIPTNVNDYPVDYSGSKTPTNNDYLVVQDGTDYGSSYTGMWRFIYIGDWSTLGKSGWAPLYRVGSAFTSAQQAAIDSGITSTKVGTYDGYSTSISALQTDKLDKVYTANKIYGTNSLGTQISYTEVTNISSNSTDTQIPSAKCVYDEFVDTVTSLQVQSVQDVTVYVTSQIPIVDKTSDTSSSFAIDPNKMYMFGTRTNLTITLNAETSGIVNEYMFLFTSGSTTTTLNVPNTVSWLQNPNIQTNKKYAVSIENNLGVIGEWN